ncbi:hypothetical protein JCM3775_004372 [Rhodotorula graminis]
MGFCSRCGEPVQASTRCRCGGLPRESATQALLDGKGSDRWTNSYTTRSTKGSSNARPNSSTPTTTGGMSAFGERTTPKRPASPTKLSSFIHDDGELHSVFGSVLSPQDHWSCTGCTASFKQEETIYPHPGAKHDHKLAETFFCRSCFAERFRVGDCKACKQAVLTDAPFVKHGSTVWHNPCFVCVYCDDPSTDAVIDLAGRPSCERCFDGASTRTRIIPPSPQPPQGAFAKNPVSVPPAPSKWGRPSLPSSSAGSSTPPHKPGGPWSSRTAPQVKAPSSVLGISGSTSSTSTGGGRTGVARLQFERDKSPIAPSLDELGDRLRRAGIKDSAAHRSPDKQAAAPSSSPSKAARPPLPQVPSSGPRPPSPVKASAAAWPPPSASPTKASFANVPRPALVPVQPVSPAPSPFDRPHSPLKPSSTSSPTKPSFPSSPTPSSAAVHVEDDDQCPVCALPLGYGDFVELPQTGALMHAECFRCGGCGEPLGAGKHVEAEGKCWHKACAPAPKRYRALVTSLAEPEPVAHGSSSPSPVSPRPLEPDLADDLGEPAPCHACGTALGVGRSVTVPRSGHSFHQKCFTCAACARAFGEEKGERGFVEVEGLPYHQRCAPPPASPSPRILNSPFFAADAQSLPSSRSTRLPTSPSFPRALALSPSSSSTSIAPTIFSRRERPPAGLGGLLVCAGCSVRSTDKETVVGPRNTRWHPRCLVCRECKRALDSECRVGDDGALRCEACRKTVGRRSYRDNAAVPPSPTKPLAPVRRI